MNKLYCINQNDNINNVLAIKYFQPRQVVLIRNRHSTHHTFEHFKQYLKDENIGIQVETLDLTLQDLAPFSINKDLKSIFILPSDNTVIGYQLMLNLFKKQVPMAYVEDDGDIFILNDDHFIYEGDSSGIEVEDYISSRGGLITSDTTDLFGHPRIVNLLNFIESNLDDYFSLFRYGTRKSPFYKSYPDNRNKLIMTPSNLSNKNKLILDAFIAFMEKNDIIQVNQRLKSKIVISFKHKSYKSYLLKTGTWLEHHLFQLFKEAGADSVESSLSFLWDKKRKAINEIDVIAVKDNRLFVASCKDRSHLDPDYINEIYTNASHLGNHESVRILFTRAKITYGLQEKADEFNVRILSYKSNHKQTIKELQQLFR